MLSLSSLPPSPHTPTHFPCSPFPLPGISTEVHPPEDKSLEEHFEVVDIVEDERVEARRKDKGRSTGMGEGKVGERGGGRRKSVVSVVMRRV